MKKQLLLTMACLLLTAKVTFAVDAYQFSPMPLTKTATAGLALTPTIEIHATQGGGLDTGYNGTGNITAIHETLGSIAVSPSSVVFSSGVASGVGITLNVAGEVDIIVTDSVTPSISSWAGHITVGPDVIDRFVMLLHQGQVMQVLQPGSGAPGYTPTWVTLTAGSPCAISVVAVDDYSNITPVGATITAQFSNPWFSEIHTQSNGIAEFLWTPQPISDGNWQMLLTAAGTFSSYPMADGWMSIITPGTFYIWHDAPTSVFAGVPFSVTTTASDSPQFKNPQNAAANFQLRLAPLLPTTAPGNGTLTPETVTIGSNGTKQQMYTYTSAETIYLNPSLISPLGEQDIAPGILPLIQVLPGSPAQLSVSVSPPAVQSGHTAIISAQVMDAYQNLIPNAPVSFTVLSTLGGAAVFPASDATGANVGDADYGVAQTVFTGGIQNETVQVECKLNELVQVVSVRISVAPPEGDAMVNYPNPFSPSQEKTSVNYYLEDDSKVEIRVYNAFGRLVLGQDISPGQGSGDFQYATQAGGAFFYWDGKNGEGQTVANGIYLVTVKASHSGGTQEFKRRVGVVK